MYIVKVNCLLPPYNNNNNAFLCVNILEAQALWRDKTTGLIKVVIV